MLIGREKEFEQLEAFLREALNPKKDARPLAIYISGKPGTGKSLTVRRVVEQLQSEFVPKGKKRAQTNSFDYVYVNCVSCKTLNNLYKEMLPELVGDASIPRGVKACEKAVHDLLEKGHRHVVLVLDELDYLGEKDSKQQPDILCKVLNWPSRFAGNVIVVGIANTTGLVDRKRLPKLECRPVCITFKPYTAVQIVEILKRECHDEDVDQKGIELIARKVAKEVGDVRQALSVIRQTITEMKANEAAEAQAALQRPAEAHQAPATPKKQRGLREALHVMNRVSASPLARARLALHPGIFLAMMLKLAEGNGSVIETSQVYGKYPKVYEHLNLPAPPIDEVSGIIDTLACQSMIAMRKKPKNGISLLVDPEIAKEAIANDNIISSVASAGIV